uniref:Neur_chan_LBD domain-containing protein n=1 Tax=Haemonchus contortus TaxID=6289 RepID=A0A7I4Z1M1_HAECO
MFILFLWHYTVLGVLARHDSPIVIERPQNRVEFDDLLMEYNHDQGPGPNVTVDVYLVVNSARLLDDMLRTSITLEQTWTDQRLQFKGVSEVPLPSNVHLWQPDTVIINALRIEPRMSSSFLNYDGTVRRRQLLSVRVPCEESAVQEAMECPIELTSFSSRGVDEISYNIDHIELDRVARFTNSTVIYDTLQDHHNRTSHMATVLLSIQKPHHILGAIVSEMSKDLELPEHK